MIEYPVHYHVERPERFSRLQLLIRLIAFVAVGMLGVSFGSIFAFLFLALPVFAAIRLPARGDVQSYAEEDGPYLYKLLHWFAAIAAWAGLIVDNLPRRHPSEVVTLEIEEEATGRPSATAPIWRVLTGLPSALVLAVLGFIGAFVWLWAALSILFAERVGPGAFNYLVGLQRWSIRLLLYQASLVDDYPPFSFSDQSPMVREAEAQV